MSGKQDESTAERRLIDERLELQERLEAELEAGQGARTLFDADGVTEPPEPEE